MSLQLLIGTLTIRCIGAFSSKEMNAEMSMLKLLIERAFVSRDVYITGGIEHAQCSLYFSLHCLLQSSFYIHSFQ